jgi:hypothetical protein
LLRIIVGLIAAWNVVAAALLLGLQGTGSRALGAGITDHAGQRLVGAHLLILAPAYILIAVRPQLYQGFLWLPLAGQLAIALTVGYSISAGDTDFGDGILAVAISAIFAGLLTFVWISEMRSTATARFDAANRPQPDDGTEDA